MIGLDSMYIESIVKAALMEDIGSGDITTLLTTPVNYDATATMTAKEEGVVAGIELARAIFKLVDPAIIFDPCIVDGAHVKPGDHIAVIAGNARGVLTAERVSLNFIQQASGVATLTAKYVELVSHTNAKIVDTRKTVPGLRRLQKYAVTLGGGYNHRFGLDDGILIKDNHIAAAGGITPAITSAKQSAPHTLKIEIEVTDLAQLQEAIEAGADIVMLDNMPLEIMREAVKIANGRVTLEASGGVNLETVKAIAEAGVDIISVGALTHSPAALDISMNIATTVAI